MLKAPLDDLKYINDRKCRKNAKQVDVNSGNRTKFIVILTVAFSLMSELFVLLSLLISISNQYIVMTNTIIKIGLVFL